MYLHVSVLHRLGYSGLKGKEFVVEEDGFERPAGLGMLIRMEELCLKLWEWI